MTSTRVLVLGLASATLSGCFLWTTRGEGDELEEQTQDQERRLAELESGIERQREELAQEVGRAKAKVTELETVLQKATQVVTRNSADIGLEVQELREQINQLEGRIAELQNASQERSRELEQTRRELSEQLTQVARRAGVDMPVDPSEVPEDRTQHFQQAYRAFQTSDYSRSRAMFREYVRRYPQDDQADDAQFWIGKSYLQENRPATALGELRKITTDYAQGDRMDDALLEMADAFYQLHACTDAQNALQALIRGFPRSPLLEQARTKLRQVQRAPRGYCTS